MSDANAAPRNTNKGKLSRRAMEPTVRATPVIKIKRISLQNGLSILLSDISPIMNRKLFF